MKTLSTIFKMGKKLKHEKSKLEILEFILLEHKNHLSFLILLIFPQIKLTLKFLLVFGMQFTI
jgi:hypothetical protein